MEENDITISKFEYDNLNRIRYKYELILSIIFNNSYLNYNEELDYDVEQINKMIRIIEPIYYEKTLKKLNKVKEEENEE